jgi:endogenous inhibitor of DNA gyrase (YacG/DUF329 family)
MSVATDSNRCPTCGKEAAPRDKNAASPFCSTRCRQVDLGKWLDEGYRIPADDSPLAADEED